MVTSTETENFNQTFCATPMTSQMLTPRSAKQPQLRSLPSFNRPAIQSFLEKLSSKHLSFNDLDTCFSWFLLSLLEREYEEKQVDISPVML
jgi:hypothetical protein